MCGWWLPSWFTCHLGECRRTVRDIAGAFHQEANARNRYRWRRLLWQECGFNTRLIWQNEWRERPFHGVTGWLMDEEWRSRRLRHPPINDHCLCNLCAWKRTSCRKSSAIRARFPLSHPTTRKSHIYSCMWITERDYFLIRETLNRTEAFSRIKRGLQ